MQPVDGSNGTQSTPSTTLSAMDLGVLSLWLGSLESGQFWDAGQLPALGHHRCGRAGPNARLTVNPALAILCLL